MPGDSIVSLVTRILGKNVDKKLGRERRHVSGDESYVNVPHGLHCSQVCRTLY